MVVDIKYHRLALYKQIQSIINIKKQQIIVQSMTQIQNEVQINSDRKINNMPVIGTQILDSNMPSELNFGSNKKKTSFNSASLNPQQIFVNNQIRNGKIVLKQFNVRGKGIFDIQTKYKQNDVINAKDRKFAVKAFNQERKGLINIWESVLGYSKRQLIIEDGQIYVTTLQQKTNKNILNNSYKLTSLMKIFVDPQQSSIRLVFKCQNGASKRINKDYRTQDLASLVEKLLLECSVIGLEVIPDDC